MTDDVVISASMSLRGIQKLSKIDRLPTKEIHNYLTFSTFKMLIPLTASNGHFFNTLFKDIHSEKKRLCR